MASTFTSNIQLEEPARGDDVGTWDTPVNANSTLLDLVVGGMATISLNNANVALSAAQFQCNMITFNSTLTGSVSITFPTSFKKPYTVYHTCTGSSAFTITLTTTAAGGQVICCPPGDAVDCFNDGTNIKFKNLGRVGEYMTIAGSTVPNWISGCTVQPYLNCDGTAFSSATWPQLAIRLGGTTLPDSRGRALYALDAGTGRVTVGQSNINGNTLLAGGGDQNPAAHAHNVFINDPGHSHGVSNLFQTVPGNVGGGGSFGFQISGNTNGAGTGIGVGSAPGNPNNTTTTAGSGGAGNMPPVLVAGLTMIRAA